MQPALAAALSRWDAWSSGLAEINTASAVVEEFLRLVPTHGDSASTLAMATRAVQSAALNEAVPAAISQGLLLEADAANAVPVEADDRTISLATLDHSCSDESVSGEASATASPDGGATVIVGIGWGYMVEMTPKEALPMLALRQDLVRDRIVTARATAQRIQSDIESVEKALAHLVELQEAQSGEAEAVAGEMLTAAAPP